ncbi:MAG: hypothetical protein VZR27_12640 [Acutalibacteraceae bacterium]|nr:hypothetical protein [Acutalibacteraceae bacterium]
MVITFDLSGRTRKELVKAISEITGERAVYKFMPTSAFEIDFFTVTREGRLEFPDRSDTEIVEQVLEGLSERGYTIISGFYENGESAMILEDEKSAETATQPDTATVAETEKLSEEPKTTAVTATQPERKATVESNGIDRFSISMSRDFLDDRTLNKLDRTIENKGELFKMAFKTDDLSYKVTDDQVSFDWFPFSGEEGEGIAYSNFIDLLTKSLKEQKRVNASKAQTENPKFAMRVYLIKLGMVGDEYKQTRKILLRHLAGSSAFRKGVPHNEDTE